MMGFYTVVHKATGGQHWKCAMTTFTERDDAEIFRRGFLLVHRNHIAHVIWVDLPTDAQIDLIKSIQDALGTAEDGEALVEVARNARRAEMELASIRMQEDYDRNN